VTGRRIAGGLAASAALALLLPAAADATGRGEPDPDDNTVCVKINTPQGSYVAPGSNCPEESPPAPAPPAPAPPPASPSGPASVAGLPAAPGPAAPPENPTLDISGLPVTPPPVAAAPPTTARPTPAPPLGPSAPTTWLPGPVPLPRASQPTAAVPSATGMTPAPPEPEDRPARRTPIIVPTPMPRLSVTATWSPERPAAGEMATVTLVVRNSGMAGVDDLVLVDEVGHSTHLRGATSADGTCTTEGRRARCALGRLAPWTERSVRLRLLIDDEPASHFLRNRVRLSSGGHMTVEEQTVSTLLAPGPVEQAGLFDLSSATVTLIVLVSFVLAHDHGRPGPRVTAP
jgi:hypothetical protein